MTAHLIHAAAAAALAPAQPAVWATWPRPWRWQGSAPARAEFLKRANGRALAAPQKAALQDRFGAASRENPPADRGGRDRAGANWLRWFPPENTGEAEAARRAGRPPALCAGRQCARIRAGRAWPGRAALAAFRAALAIFPGYAEAHANMAPVLARLGRGEDARRAWRTAITLTPDLVAALAGLGHLLLADGKPLAALHWLDRAAALAPERVDVTQAMGNAHTILRDYAAAHAAFAAAARATGRKAAMPLMMLAQAAAHLGRDDEAEADFRAALALEPQNATVRGAFGGVSPGAWPICRGRGRAADCHRRQPGSG